MFGKAARNERKAKRLMGQMDDMLSGIVIQWAEQTGDRLEAKITEMRKEYGETAPAEIAGPAHMALWTYNKSTEALDDGQHGAAKMGFEAIDVWLGGGEMIVPGTEPAPSTVAS